MLSIKSTKFYRAKMRVYCSRWTSRVVCTYTPEPRILRGQSIVLDSMHGFLTVVAFLNYSTHNLLYASTSFHHEAKVQSNEIILLPQRDIWPLKRSVSNYFPWSKEVEPVTDLIVLRRCQCNWTKSLTVHNYAVTFMTHGTLLYCMSYNCFFLLSKDDSGYCNGE